MSEKVLRCVWLVDGSPADVLRSDAVSMPSEIACLAVEAFTFTVSFGGIAAFRAGSACVFRVNEDYWNPCKFTFICNKLLQLVKAPAMDCSPLAATFNRYSQTYAFEFLKSYASESVLSFLNNPFADGVVYCCSEPMFFSAAFPEEASSRLCSFALKPAPEFDVPSSDSVKLSPSPTLLIAISCNVPNSDIYSKDISWFERFGFWHFNGGVKVECTVSEDKVSLPTDFVNSCLLICTNQHGDILSSVHSQDAYGFKPFPTENSLVVYNCAMQIERCFNRFACFVSVSYLADCPHSQLCGEPKFISDVAVNKVVELPIVESSSLKGGFRDAIASLVEGFHCLPKQLELCFRWNKFDGYYLLHNFMDSNLPYLTIIPIPSPHECGVSLEGFYQAYSKLNAINEAYSEREAMCNHCSWRGTCKAAYVPDVPCPDAEETEEELGIDF